MSIREVAKELYRLEQEVKRHEDRLAGLPARQREELERELARAKAERDRFRKILGAKKDPPPYRTPR